MVTRTHIIREEKTNTKLAFLSRFVWIPAMIFTAWATIAKSVRIFEIPKYVNHASWSVSVSRHCIGYRCNLRTYPVEAGIAQVRPWMRMALERRREDSNNCPDANNSMDPDRERAFSRGRRQVPNEGRQR